MSVNGCTLTTPHGPRGQLGRTAPLHNVVLTPPPVPGAWTLDACCFDAGQRRILSHLCRLVPEQIRALDGVLPDVRLYLSRILPARLVGAQGAAAASGASLAPRAKHRAICVMIATLDQALHAGFIAHYGSQATHTYAPRVSASAKSTFLDVVNLCYDAAGFPGVSAAKAIDTYRRSLLRDGLRASCASHVSPRRDECRTAADGEEIRDRMPICGEHALPADTNSIL